LFNEKRQYTTNSYFYPPQIIMMFQKQSIAILLACITSASAFTPASFSRKVSATTFVPTTAVIAVPSYSKINNALFSDEEESSEPVAETVEATEVISAEADKSSEKGVKPFISKQLEEDDINCVAYVVNLSYETEHGDLKSLFGNHGKVGKVFIPKNKETGKSKGIAFVSMATEAERDSVIAVMNETEVGGRTIYVDKARPRGEVTEKQNLTKIYIGNISYETSPEQLKEHFSQYGEVSNIYIPTDRYTGNPRGFAFLALKPEDAEKAIAGSDGILMDERTIEVKVSLPRGAKAPNRQNETKLYIGNISFETELATLREVFEDYGPIVDLYLPTDQNTGRPRGFAFVTLEPENATRAIEEVDGWEVDGRELRVNTAQPKGSSNGNGEGFNNNQEGYNSNEESTDADFSATNEW